MGSCLRGQLDREAEISIPTRRAQETCSQVKEGALMDVHVGLSSEKVSEITTKLTQLLFEGEPRSAHDLLHAYAALAAEAKVLRMVLQDMTHGAVTSEHLSGIIAWATGDDFGSAAQVPT